LKKFLKSEASSFSRLILGNLKLKHGTGILMGLMLILKYFSVFIYMNKLALTGRGPAEGL